jgi:hypothetical protein
MAEFLNENDYALGVNGLTIVDADGNILYSLPIAEGLEGQSLVVAANGSLVFGEGAANVAGYAGNSYLTSTYVTNTVFQSYVANTNPRFNRYLEVANVSTVTGDYVSNTVFQAALANTNYQITVTQNDIELNLANTNNYIADVAADQTQYLQVANATVLFNDRLQVANATTLLNNKMDVANTQALYNTLVANTLSTANANFYLEVANANFLSLSGGIVSGNVEITGNLQVDGDLTVIGNTVTVTANNLSISDNFLYLNDGGGNLNIDMGWGGGYNDGTYRHAGVFRDASDGRFKFFDEYVPELSANVNINTSHPSFNYAPLQAGAMYSNNSPVITEATVLKVYDVANTQVYP